VVILGEHEQEEFLNYKNVICFAEDYSNFNIN
jgi:hypothetical protein